MNDPVAIVTCICFCSCLMGCLSSDVWNYQLYHICSYSAFYPLKGMFSLPEGLTAHYSMNACMLKKSLINDKLLYFRLLT